MRVYSCWIEKEEEEEKNGNGLSMLVISIPLMLIFHSQQTYEINLHILPTRAQMRTWVYNFVQNNAKKYRENTCN